MVELPAYRRIEEELRRRLATYEAGARFATEAELCKEFGVSRMTVNKVLVGLESEGLLRRERGRGTFVGDLRRSRPLIFLLPCPEYMVYDCTYPLRLVMYGVECVARKLGIRVEGRWVSATNDPGEIEIEQLLDIGEGSDVIVFSGWFRHVFPLLRERGCRVVYVGGDMREAYGVEHGWPVVSVDMEDGVCRGVAHLLGLGCRRIGFVYHYHRNNHYLKQAFERAVSDGGGICAPELMRQVEFPDSLERAVSGLVGAGAEAILLSRADFAGSALRVLRGNGVAVPGEVALLALGDGEWLLREDPAVSAVGIPYVAMGRAALEVLYSGGNGKLLLPPRICVRGSTVSGALPETSADCFPVSSDGGNGME